MSAPGCNYSDGDEVSTIAPGAGSQDTSPRSRRRGRFRGFLPDGTRADLATLADSGVGIDAMGHGRHTHRSGGLLVLILATVVLVSLARRDH